MKNLNFQVIPSVEESKALGEACKWFDEKPVAIKEGNGKTTLFLGIEEIVQMCNDDDTEYDSSVKTKPQLIAWPVRVNGPVTRGTAINAAEMSAYGLKSAMDVASFNSALARKSREDHNDAEVIEHDDFIKQVKKWLDEIGLTSDSVEAYSSHC